MLALLPFGGDGPPLTLTGALNRAGSILTARFELRGELESIKIAPPAERPERRDELWRTTCFEFFFGAKGEAGYREVNLSPAGHWNVYAFDSYRAGMRPEAAIEALPFTLERDSGSLALSLALNLTPLYAPSQSLEASLTAVIETVGGAQSFWALTHAAPEADFHQRASFSLSL